MRLLWAALAAAVWGAPCSGVGRQEGGRCLCPLDYNGNECELPRQLRCDVTLSSEQCEVYPHRSDMKFYNPQLLGGMPCAVSLHSQLTFDVDVSCSFADEKPLSEVLIGHGYDDMHLFDYAIFNETQNIALSKASARIYIKAFDLSHITNDAQRVIYDLAQETLSGAGPMSGLAASFSSLATAPSFLVNSGRIYIEAGLTDTMGLNISTSVVQRGVHHLWINAK